MRYFAVSWKKWVCKSGFILAMRSGIKQFFKKLLYHRKSLIKRVDKIVRILYAD